MITSETSLHRLPLTIALYSRNLHAKRCKMCRRAKEALLMGTAVCTAMDVISILRKKRQEVTDYQVHIHGTRVPTHPMVFTSITIEHVVSGHHISEEAVARAIELSVTKYCGAHAMLSKTATITTTHRILEVATA